MENEVWKDVVGYEGLYEVSNLGRVKSKTRKNTILLKPSETKGYLFVFLCKDKKVKRKSIHRLVANAFIENPYNYPIINHVNENKADNRVENLEWCSAKYNINYYFDMHPKKREEYRNNFTDKDGKHFNPVGARKRLEPIAQINENFEIIEIYNSAADVGRKLNIKSDDVYQSCKRNELREKMGLCHGKMFMFLNNKRLNQLTRNQELIFSYKNSQLCDK